MRVLIILSFILAAASAASVATGQKIIGGQETHISQYPSMANLLVTSDLTFFIPVCAGTIINTRSILTAASCMPSSSPRLRARVGSSFASSGGTVLTIQTISIPGNYNPITHQNDISVIRTVPNGISFVAFTVMPAAYATAVTSVPDNSFVRIVGWGRTEIGHFSEQLRHGQAQTLNSSYCASLMGPQVVVPNSMFCTSWTTDVCQGDNGSPIFFNNVVVGVVIKPGCGNFYEPSLSTRVSLYNDFINGVLNLP